MERQGRKLTRFQNDRKWAAGLGRYVEESEKNSGHKEQYTEWCLCEEKDGGNSTSN